MNTTSSMQIVVVGGGTGAAEALARLLQPLSPHLDMAMLVALRVGRGPGAWGRLATLISERTSWPVEMAEEGSKLERGRIYLARFDSDLLVRDGGVLGLDGKPASGPRPSADRLFASAAAAYGQRVIGVVLSGDDGDGTAGLRAIKARGGVTIVQSPVDALMPSMPSHALRYDDPDHSVFIDDLGGLLGHLVRTRGQVIS